jgi:dinuclear metal center YbgI/SA1388 family protein
MIESIELGLYLKNFLKIDQFDDYCPNGLQVEGKKRISVLAFAVSATQSSIAEAVRLGADGLIVHHGLFWKFHGTKEITGPHYQRIAKLIKNDLSLFAYHLPLDAHLEIGNAASLGQALGLKNMSPFAEYRRAPLGIKGSFEQNVLAKDLEQKLENVLKHPILWAKSSIPQIKTVGIITGGANNEWKFAYQDGLDAYITGEMSEHNYHDAIEHEVHMFAGGHHATERLGIQSLMMHLKDKFQLKCFFIDSENPA